MQNIDLNKDFFYCGITTFSWVKSTTFSTTVFLTGIHALDVLELTKSLFFIALYLLSGDAHVIPHIRENSGLNEEPFQAQGFASALQLGSFTDATLDKLQHTILLLLTDLWGRRRHITSDPRAEEIIKER